MRSGHIIYKVNNLQAAVEEWRNKGFEVEYGRKKNPFNALIYFSEGAYIELLQNTGMPKIVIFFSKVFGVSKKMERFYYWNNCDEGWCGFCIEKDFGNLDEEVAFLNKNGIKGVLFNNLKRVDTKDRVLKYKCFFPEGLDFPFLMSYFSIDPKPVNFTHPNGIRKIKKIVFKIDEKNASILKQLIQDDVLEIIVDDKEKGIVGVEYDMGSDFMKKKNL
ncbi:MULTISPECIES: VOC family protein [Terrabacteria group]|uniref:VOC family protein n=1 Tax=Bacillati TaxID=1783272 RepID=UPI00193AC373|nr:MULTISPECIES: VOC family protein [Terrabacteria group]MBW9212012.1 VOC family protein [Trueperella sp. zg.1013]QRG87181.1 VOC family protein [Bulleidia sp. zg-1006]